MSRAAPAHARLRPLGEPRSVRVETDGQGVPVAVSLPRRRPVVAIRESWRIDDEWWRRPISRAYHVVVLDNGRLLTLFRDRLLNRWYLQD